MDIRHIGVLAVIGLSGCSGHDLDVGGAAGRATGSSGGATSGSSGGTAAPATCDAGLSTGAGFIAAQPTECTAAPGTPHSVTSINDVLSLLVGQWVACNSPVLPGSDVGMQFTADGRYIELAEADDHSLVAVGSPGVPMVPVGSSGISGSTTADPAVSPTGTFSIVDGSSMYGPGTFELHMEPDNGGAYDAEITFTDSPRAFFLFYPNSGGIAYVPPAPWTPRANVCSACDSPSSGTPIDQNDPAALSADVVGRWVWCAGDFAGQGGLAMGVEFTSDGSWYWLVEAVDGTLSRDTDPLGNGTFTFTQEMQPSATYPNPGPYNLEFHTQGGDTFATQAVVTQNSRTLRLGYRTSASSNGIAEDYSYLSPLP